MGERKQNGRKTGSRGGTSQGKVTCWLWRECGEEAWGDQGGQAEPETKEGKYRGGERSLAEDRLAADTWQETGGFYRSQLTSTHPG